MLPTQLRDHLRRFGAMTDADAIDAFLNLMVEDTGADLGIAFRLCQSPMGARACWARVQGRNEALRGDVDSWIHDASACQWPDYARPRTRDIGIFSPLRRTTRTGWSGLLVTGGVSPAVGHVLRMLVYDNDEFIGWFGVARASSTPFQGPVVRRWREASATVQPWLLSTLRPMLQRSTREGHAVVVPDGRIQFATPGIAHLLPLCTDAVRQIDWTNTSERTIYQQNHRISIQPGLGSGGPAVLASIAPAAPLRRAPDSLLTPAQRKVASYAASGSTNKEIASNLHTAEETVKTHLKEVYRRLDVNGRTELAARLRATPLRGATRQ